ncbi:hypothetical protein [Streptomyces melanogenes]|uniref:hypothetical protein n=1 Tax=Streptomyces melanogenes TaxID=67326 RepID=UPI00167D623E|nr:hypothetical protein [Streptomyces melanogenes]GGP95674.1 hypothetical protein GCM10010278_86670 [Streptomyces melanogenes]
MRLTHRVSSIGAALGISVSALLFSSAAPSNAAATADPCAGKSETYVIKTYTRNFQAVPLRCGTSTWGYRHIVAKHGFDDGQIANTVARGRQSFGFYYTNLNQCPPMTFKVVFNDGALGGTGVRPQGIITAYYQPGHITSIAHTGSTPAC